MTDWKYYEELEEESYSKTRKVRTKKKKTWKLVNVEKISRPTKKQWQKKRKSRNEKGNSK